MASRISLLAIFGLTLYLLAQVDFRLIELKPKTKENNV